MSIEFKLPDIGEGVAEGEITNWMVSEGDAIKEDAPMVEVMTDKATVEITSPVTGRVGKILAQAGDVVPVHSVIVVLEEEGGAPASAPAAAAPAAPAPAPAPTPAAAPAPAAPAPAAAVATATNHKVLAAPATRKLARDLGVDIGLVPGSGPRGRVTREDVQAFQQGGAAPAAPAAPAPAAPAAAPAPAPTPMISIPSFPEGSEERVPYRGIRKAIGDQMMRSKSSIPHFTYVDEIDMTELYALRKKAAAVAAESGVKFTFLPLIIKALCSAIKRYPSVNALMDEAAGELTIKHDVHVGIATDTDRGLLVPVIRSANRKSALEVAADLQRLSEEARAGKASREDLSGSTITITSAGSIGGLFATPIINYPEVAILGVYQIKDKPVIRDGEIVPGKIGYLSITLDHRVVDGATAAYLMNHIKRLLENPALMVIDS